MKKIVKNFIVLFILLIILFNLTGCYDAKGIESLAYAVAIGLDITDDNKLELSIQFATSGESSGGSSESSESSQSSDSSVTSVICTSISTGISLINSHISKKINLSHCQVLIISEELAALGISEYLDTLANNVELRSDCGLIISKCTAKEYLNNVQPSLETLTARYYEDTLYSSEYTGYTVNTNFSEFYSSIKDTYSQGYAILGNIKTEDTSTNTQINADYTAGENPVEDSDVIETLGIAVFNGDKFVGELTGLNSICHLIVNNDLEECTLSIPSPFEEDKYLDLYLTTAKAPEITADKIDSSYNINIDVYLTATGLSLDSNIAYNSEEAIKLVEESGGKYIKEQIENYLYTTSQIYNSDICGFGRYVVKNYTTMEEWNNANWLENYRNSSFTVNVDLTVESGNMFSKS